MEIIDGIVVTGASSGIGEALAYRISRRQTLGLVIAGRTQDRLSTVAARCYELGAPRVEISCGDLREPESIQQLVSSACQYSSVWGLVNSAGIGHFASLEDYPDESLQELLDVNVKAMFLVCKAFLPLLRSSAHRSTIVNISSDADTVGFAHAAVYCASKGAVLAMSRALRCELRPYGVRVCVVSPGRVDTPFNKRKVGDRPGALKADDVAEAIEFALFCSGTSEVQEIRLDSMAAPPPD